MLESFLDFKEIKNRPHMMLIWAVIISSIAVLISAQISYKVPIGETIFNLSGLFSVLFTIIPAAYFLTVMIKREEALEEREIIRYHKKSFWEKHKLHLIWTSLFFIGLTLSFAFWCLVLPEDFFQVQHNKIDQIQGRITGEYIRGDFNSFVRIVYNNLQVMIFAFLFSLIFGAGAVFIITWNASILGVAIARNCKHIAEIPLVGLGYLPHGLPEITAYLLAGLAGGIISAAVIKRNDWRVLKVIIMDSLKLLVLASILIVIAGIIEVYL